MTCKWDPQPAEHAPWSGSGNQDYEAEAEERWGGTEAYKASHRRVSSYTKEDWLRVEAEAQSPSAPGEAEAIGCRTPGSEEAMEGREEHRRHIMRWFYDYSSEIHVGLGEMNVADPRFMVSYEAISPGLAEYLRDAMKANAKR